MSSYIMDEGLYNAIVKAIGNFKGLSKACHVNMLKDFPR